MTTINVYAPITKSELNDDGTMSVYGMATGPQLDHDLQICDPEWLKTAVPEWFSTGANIRQMHQAIAVGVGTELEQLGDDHWVTAKVVDAAAQRLVDHGVLQGFSIGIKSPKVVKDASAPNGRIVGGKIVEISLVDRPCNESAKLVLAKMVGADVVEVEELTKDASMDTAGDGTEPGEESAETDLIQVARDALAAWLASEAGEVASGTGGLFVVQLVLNVLSDLEWAAEADAYDDAAALEAVKAVLITPPQEAEVLKLATVADLVKAALADEASEDESTAVAELRKALGIDDVDDKIATALTKAATAEDLDKVAVRLAKVEGTAMTSGPVRVTPQHDAATTAANDRLTKAAHFRDLASHVTDRDQAAAYRAMADQLDPPMI